MVSVQKNLEFSTGLTAAQGIAHHEDSVFIVDEDDDHLYRFDGTNKISGIANPRIISGPAITGNIAYYNNKIFEDHFSGLYISDYDNITETVSNRRGPFPIVSGAITYQIQDGRAFILTNSGIAVFDYDDSTETFSNARPIISLSPHGGFDMKIRGNKIFVASGSAILIYDYDPATNTISNVVVIPTPDFRSDRIEIVNDQILISESISSNLYVLDFDFTTNTVTNISDPINIGNNTSGLIFLDNKLITGNSIAAFPIQVYDVVFALFSGPPADLGVLPIQFARGLDVYMDGDILKAAVIDTETDHLWTFDLVGDGLENPTDLFPLNVNGGHGVSRFDDLFWVADDHSNGLHSYAKTPAVTVSDRQTALSQTGISGITFGNGFAFTAVGTVVNRYSIADNGVLNNPLLSFFNVGFQITGVATNGSLFFVTDVISEVSEELLGTTINADNTGVENIAIAIPSLNSPQGAVLHGGFIYIAETDRISVWRTIAQNSVNFNREYSLPNNNITGIAAIGTTLLTITSAGVLSTWRISTSSLTLIASTQTGVDSPTGMAVAPSGRLYIANAAGVVHFDLSLDPVYPKADIGGFGARNIRALTVSERGAIISDITDDALFVYPFNEDRTGILEGRQVQSTENIVNALGLDSEGDQLYAILNLATRTIVRYTVTDMLFVRKIFEDSYDIGGFLRKEFADSFAIRGKVRQALSDSYMIRGKVRRTFDDMYDIGRNLVIKVFRDSYAVRGRVQKEFADQYPIAKHVRKEFSDSYNVRNAVRAVLADSFTIRGKIRRTLMDSYVIRGKIGRTFDDMYSIGRVVIVKVFADSYAIRGKVRHEFADSFLIRGKVRRILFDSYPIGKYLRREFADSYVIAGFVRAVLADSYVIRGFVRKKLFDMYGIGRFIVIKVFADSYDIRGKVRAEMADQYPIGGFVRKTFQDAYPIAKFLRKVFLDSYSIADTRLGFVFRRSQRGEFPVRGRQRKTFRF